MWQFELFVKRTFTMRKYQQLAFTFTQDTDDQRSDENKKQLSKYK